MKLYERKNMEHDTELLRMAQVGCVTLRDHYQKYIDELEARINPQHDAPGLPKARKRFSAATRAKMRASQQARWAAKKAKKPKTMAAGSSV